MTTKKTGRRKAAKQKPGRPTGSQTVHSKDPNGNKHSRFSSEYQPNTKVIAGVYRYVPDPQLLKQQQRVVRRRPRCSAAVKKNKPRLLDRLRGPVPKAKAQPYRGTRPPRAKQPFIKFRDRNIVRAYRAAQALLPELKRKPVRAISEQKRKRRVKPGWKEVMQLLGDECFGKLRPHRNTITKVLKKSCPGR